MWMRMLVELQARRITQLEQVVQKRQPRQVFIGERTCVECGNNLAAEGQEMCSDCLERLGE